MFSFFLAPGLAAQMPRHDQSLASRPPKANRRKMIVFAAGSLIDCTPGILTKWDWDRCGHSIARRAGYKDPGPAPAIRDWASRPYPLPNIDFYPLRGYDFILKPKNNLPETTPRPVTHLLKTIPESP